MTRIKGPVVVLVEAQALVRKEAVFLSQTARKDLSEHFGSWAEARRAVSALLTALIDADYDHSVRLPNPPSDCDIYGLVTTSTNPKPPPPTLDTAWYIKFYDDIAFDPPHEDVLRVVSFHHDRPPGLRARRKVNYP